MKKILLFALATTAAGFSMSQSKLTSPAYKNKSLPVAARVADLLKRMTLEEKAGQLNQLNGGVFTGPAANDIGQQAKMQQVREGRVGSMLNVTGAAETRAVQQIAVEQSRLGIPLLFGFDVVHGYKTVFPIPLAEACGWDMAQVERNAAVAAKEASAAGVHWAFAPMCDVSNDPRWGRVMEGGGEDPWYLGELSAARVKGFQGKLDDGAHILACVKHFGAYGAVEAGREYNYTDVSRVALFNKYLPPYKAAVAAGAASVMNGFNVLEGVPVSANSFLVNDVLKKKWGFKGFLVSDWQSYKEMIAWGYASDDKDAAYKAFAAGSMMDMEARVVEKWLPVLVKEGKISQQQVDDAVGRVLHYKFALGLFDDPYRFSDEAREKKILFAAENRREAREAAKRSIVLLKNEGQVLPLAKSTRSVALIGYYANSKEDMFDFWIGKGEYQNAVTIYEGLKNALPAGTTLSYSDGYRADATTDDQLIKEAVQQAQQADVVLVNVGISGKLAGEDRSLAYPEIPEGQLRLLKALQQTGKPVVALVSSGRPLILTQLQPLVSGIVQCWILGTETGGAVADVITGAYNPSGKTVLSFPYAIGQIPVYYNHFNTGRPIPPLDGDSSWKSRYRDIPNDPLYPFGYGLSYTSFQYSNLMLSSNSMAKGGKQTVTVTVTNTGKYTGEEVAQLYIQDVAASVIRPVKELKAYQKISLAPGESKTIRFVLTQQELSFYNAAGNLVCEPGVFKVFAGGNSRDVLLQQFELQ